MKLHSVDLVDLGMVMVLARAVALVRVEGAGRVMVVEGVNWAGAASNRALATLLCWANCRCRATSISG